jgi:hypothetical protein
LAVPLPVERNIYFAKEVLMDDQMHSQPYETPHVTDYGDLQELTAACANGGGGDAFAPSGSSHGISFGTSNPAYGCKSAP